MPPAIGVISFDDSMKATTMQTFIFVAETVAPTTKCVVIRQVPKHVNSTTTLQVPYFTEVTRNLAPLKKVLERQYA